MKTLITILLFSFVGLYYCSPGQKCCPESDLGILCEDSVAKTKAKCGPGFDCCLRLDLAYDCCDDTTEFCNPSLGGCIPIENVTTTLIPVKVGIFSENLSYAIARTRFLWVQEGLNVTYVVVRGSTSQFDLLRTGQVDFISTGIDNSINYALNVNNPVGQGAIETISVLATDLGSNHAIVVLPNITTFSDLTNTIVGVDAAASGFAYIVYDILASGGLPKQNYHVKEVGGGAQRLAAILAGTASAVLLSGEQLIVAQASGLKILRTYADIKNPIELVSAVSVPPAYLSNNSTRIIVQKFIRAYYIATQYLTNPANRNAIIALIEAANISSNSSMFYDLNTSPIYGIKANGIINPQGMYEVISLRNRYGGFQSGTLSNNTICQLTKERSPSNPNGLYSTEYLEDAVESLGYAFNNNDGKNCAQLGINNIINDSSAFTFIMPVALIITVVLSLLFL